MDRRLLTGLVVLGVAIAVGLGIIVFGGGDDSDDGSTTSTNAELSNDERPATDGETGGDKGNGKGGGEKDDSDGRGNNGGSDSGSADGSDDEPTGPPIEQDPPSDGGSDEPVGDPAEVAAVTDTLTTYLQSIAAGDGDGACSQLSSSGVTTMLKKIAKIAPETRGAPCPQAILLYQGAYGKTAVDPSFKSIEVSGGNATAVGPLKEPASLSQTSGGWLIDEYGQ